MKRRIQLLLGDTAGVGPELCARVVADLPDQAEQTQIIVTGDRRVFDEAQRVTGTKTHLPVVTDSTEFDSRTDPVIFWDSRSVDAPSIARKKVSKEAGQEVLSLLMNAINLAKEGVTDGIVFAPFNKESMHKAGAHHYSELELFKEEFDRPDIPGEFNILDKMWIARVTSHIPVRDITTYLTVERISHTTELLGEAQARAGLTPRLAVAALNPHAGEHGMFGDEEGTIIAPAIQRVQDEHPSWTIEGPFPADTLFPRVQKGDYTGVVGMYHDQLQIATKIIGLERGVTLHPGMKVPIATAAHGTAFDLQGTGRANHTALKNALAVVCEMVGAR